MDKPLLLVVEDEPINREVLVDTLSNNGYAVITAETGVLAWQLIEKYLERLDAILLDRLLPDMDSLELLKRMKADASLVHVPVIMQTSLSTEADIADGLKAGAYYYLTKPYPPEMLLSIVRTAVRDWRDYLELQHSLRQTRSILSHLDRGEFWFATQMQARDLATLLAHAAPQPERVVLGLTELMLNAVEHGNLGISYHEKTRLIGDDRLQSEVERRLSLPEYAKRRAVLSIERTADSLKFIVRDDGNGFNWASFVEMSPKRAFDTHGRGIAMSRLISFDRIDYNARGNEVTAVVDLTRG